MILWQCGIRGEDVKSVGDGCLHCYIHKSDSKRNVNTNEIVKTKDLIKQAKLSNIDFKSNG